MRKVYEPLPMIMNGRYAVLYGKLSAKEKEDTLARMAALIEEERDYEDRGNYTDFRRNPVTIFSVCLIDFSKKGKGSSYYDLTLLLQFFSGSFRYLTRPRTAKYISENSAQGVGRKSAGRVAAAGLYPRV